MTLVDLVPKGDLNTRENEQRTYQESNKYYAIDDIDIFATMKSMRMSWTGRMYGGNKEDYSEKLQSGYR